MTQPAKSQEPSMEEILASIRRIIADDDATKSERPAEPAKAPAPPPPQAAPVPPPPAPRPPAAALRVAPPEPSLPEPDAASFDAADGGAAGPGDASDHSSSDILDLTESMAAPMPPPPVSPSPMPDAAPQFRTIDGSFDVSYEEAAEKPAPQRHSGDGGERAQLMSRQTSAAVDSAFNTLAQTVLVQNARTLEDLVREMLRPMLKSWLDDNLPGMVERLVRAEIERVSRGRMG
jgi:cell pole-organizing protein PopZ